MMPRITKRQVVLGVALLLTLAATADVWVRDRKTATDGEVALAVTKPGSGQTAPSVTQAAGEIPPVALPARTLQEAERDIFAIPRKELEPEPKKPPVGAPPPPPVVLPPPIVPVAPPPPPTAPPLPFTYLGKLNEEGKVTVFLSARGRSYVVKSGEVVAQVYRIDEIKPPTLTMTYLPMKIQQTMQIGEAN